jgi:predicted transport protein
VASGEVRPQPRTLGLPLEVNPAKKVEDSAALVGRVANYGLFGIGETQACRST